MTYTHMWTHAMPPSKIKLIAKHSTVEYDRQMKLNGDLLSKITFLNGDRGEDGEEESGGFMNDLKKGIMPSPMCMYMCAK
jgi:hypothetical protein